MTDKPNSLETIESRITALELRLSALENQLRKELDFYRGIQIGDEESLRWLWTQFMALQKQVKDEDKKQ